MKKLFAALILPLLACSCVPPTPLSRIDRDPRKFEALSPTHQALVKRGEISRGMPPAAVEIAWGNPSQRFEGVQNGKLIQRWDYTGSRPIYGNSFYGGFGYGGFGRFGNCHPMGFGFGPDVTYVPYRIASVWFLNNRVDGWERLR